MRITVRNHGFVYSLQTVRPTLTDSHANQVAFHLPGPAILFNYFVLSVRLLGLLSKVVCLFVNTDDGQRVIGWIGMDAW